MMKRTRKQTNIVSVGRLDLVVTGDETARADGLMDRVYAVMPGERETERFAGGLTRLLVNELK